MGSTYEGIFKESVDKLDSLSSQCEKEIESWGNIDIYAIEKSESSLDAWDYCFSIAIGMAGAKISTSKELEDYLKDIHNAASGATGDYSVLKKILGSLLHHQGDSIDKLASEKRFINRAYEPADIGYHRLLWGHDIFNFSNNNPFKLMFDQKGIKGILQAIRHLIADTMSKQGLPFPGSSYLDYTNENGKISNYLIDIAKKLSTESVGNKRNAQSIYSHMFTVRAQDIISGGAIKALAEMYFKIRKIEDVIRIIQFRLIAYSVTFFGEAFLGAINQNGIPYVNIPLATVMFKNLGQLYYYNNKEIHKLHIETYELIAQGDKLTASVEEDDDILIHYDNAIDYYKELSQGQSNVDSLIDAFERGTS